VQPDHDPDVPIRSPATPARHRIGVVVAAPAVDRTHVVHRLQPGSVHRPLQVLARPGGKGFNVAHVLRALDEAVVAAAPLAGPSGRWLAEAANRAGIDCRPTWVPGDLRTCLSVYAEADGSLTEFYEMPQPVAAGDWARFVTDAIVTMTEIAGDRAGTGSDRPSVVVISGRLPPGAPPDGLVPIVASLVARGAFVAVDSDGDGLLGSLTARPSLVKVNAAEASGLLSRPINGVADARSAAEDLCRAGAWAAVVTLGGAGAVAVAPTGEPWLVGRGPVTGGYPVGSGDAFLAGMMSALAAGASFADQLRMGAAAAAANSERPGAGMLDAVRVRELRDRMEIKPLSG
jgi:1-phosphofructokinase family hexose kinase